MRCIIYLSLILQLVFFGDLSGQSKFVCMTVDDLPLVSYGKNDRAHLEKVTNGMLSTFKKYNVPAIGYVNAGKIFKNGKPDSSQIDILEKWLSQGFELGNHTYSHMSYHHSTFEAFTNDIVKGEKFMTDLCNKYGQNYVYFRHPFLRIGDSKGKADSLDTFLEDRGYKIAPVTFENTDYYFAKAYHIAFLNKDTVSMRKIGEEYISYSERMLDYHEDLLSQMFNREIRHISLIHANLLNAHYLDQLIDMYLRKGFTFISQEEALEDPIYDEEILKFGNYGISWIDRWALNRNKKGEFFEGFPKMPEFVKEWSEK